jgi:tetratricopeptide (TPR) repeat protein
MKHLHVIALVFLAFSPFQRAGAADTYELITNGRIREAADSLARYTTASTRDGNILFLQALIEPDADKSGQLMEAALKADLTLEYREETLFRLAQYYFVNGDFLEMARVVNEYRTRWEAGRYDPEMRRLSILADEKSRQFDRALDQIDKYLVRNPDGDANQWGEIDKARVMLLSNKRIGAVKMLRSLSRKSNGPGVAQALYLLATDALANKQFDDAVFFYNLLREAYPSAVGLDALVESLGDNSAPSTNDNTAEKLTGTYYSVKVGVFSEKDNARRQQDIFKTYGKPIDIESKGISGKTYHVVYVGRFTSYSDAVLFKETLESNHREAYQVVAR